MTEERDLAIALTRWLTDKSAYGPSSSVLERYVEERIRQIARDTADVVVSTDNTLRDLIRQRVTETVAAALAADQVVNRAVVDAVSKALASRALEEDDDE